MSLREGFDGFRFARDMRTYGVRATWLRRRGVQPWLDGGGFHRPRFTCVPSVPCTDQGGLVRLGVRLPLYSGGRRGLRGALLAGAGAAFAEETVPAYLFGLGFDWPLVPRLAPTVEVRWESVVEVNTPMIAVGVRLDL